jgi:oligopeptide transport system permease protein
VIGLIVRRLAQLPIIVLLVYTITLTLAWAVPGNPLDNPEGRQPPKEVVEAMKRQYNLDSYWKFYFSYLSNITGVDWLADHYLSDRAKEAAERAREAGVAPPSQPIFNMGPSLQYEDWTVNEVVATSLPVSITLGAAAILIALLVGVGAGIVGAVKPNSFADLATLAVALIGISLPSFVTGTVLLLLFAVLIPVFPVGQWGPWGAVLPSVTLSLPFAAYIARLTRLGMIENLQADFVRTARAKGVSEAKVLLKHALKNAFLPVLSFLGPAAALAMTGSFIVEKVFNVPGMGQHFVNGVLNKDLFLIMGVVLIFSTMLILFNLAVDVMYRWVDPRIE